MSVLRRLSIRKLSGFRNAEAGSATVEAVLWIPMLFLIFGLIVDVSMIYGNRALVLRVIQDENRAYALHRPGYDSPADVVNGVKARIVSISPGAVVTSKITGTNSDRIQTTVSLKGSEIDAIGMISLFTSMNVFVWAQHMIEDV